jgi:hypothetical protein
MHVFRKNGTARGTPSGTDRARRSGVVGESERGEVRDPPVHAGGLHFIFINQIYAKSICE